MSRHPRAPGRMFKAVGVFSFSGLLGSLCEDLLLKNHTSELQDQARVLGSELGPRHIFAMRFLRRRHCASKEVDVSLPFFMRFPRHGDVGWGRQEEGCGCFGDPLRKVLLVLSKNLHLGSDELWLLPEET